MDVDVWLRIVFASIAVTALVVAALACDRSTADPAGPEQTADQSEQPQSEADQSKNRADERARMVRSQLTARGIDDETVLEAMRAVPRHEYVPEQKRDFAYHDSPLPIGLEQTISQPYIVALMSQLLDASPGDRVLEIGTGSGYQAAVLAEMGTELYTIEILCELAERAERDLERTGYGDDVEVKCGDGYEGWPDHAPFDRIIVTAAPPEIPDALVEQLAANGKMVVPVGDHFQTLQVVEKTDAGDIEITDKEQVRFVPMVPDDEVD